MHPLLILLIGVVIVVGGVLIFRLHAFLALTLAALAVAALTPQAAVERYWIEKKGTATLLVDRLEIEFDDESQREAGGEYVLLAEEDRTGEEGLPIRVEFLDAGDRTVAFARLASSLDSGEAAKAREKLRQARSKDAGAGEIALGVYRPGNRQESVGTVKDADLSLLPAAPSFPAHQGMQFELFRAEGATGPLEKSDAAAEVLRIVSAVGPEGKKRSLLLLGTVAEAESAGRPSSGDVLITPLERAAAEKTAGATVGERVAAAFGDTCAKIGILIALAAIIGKCLLDSGAADRIVRSALKRMGEPGAPAAFVGSGFLLGIPVFFDTVFYLMMPLGKAMRLRTGRNYLLYVLTIVAGASMAHSLVPPTPGPLLVAGELGVDLGLMILAGCVVGLFSASAAAAFALFVNRRYEVPLRESEDFSLKDLQEIAGRDDRQLPPLALSLAPIVLPVLLISGYTVLDSFTDLSGDHPAMLIAESLGNKNIALAAAAAIAIALLVWKKRTSLKELAGSMQSALASGGVIILITAAGGAFGAMLQETGVAGLIDELPPFSTLVVLALAFLITTAIRTAQGSATVAMITAVGVLAAFAEAGRLDCHPVFLALAIGCGSKPIAWMNDSGFWVICKMSGMTEGEGLRFVTPMSILMGLVGLAVTLAGAWIFMLLG